MTLELYEYTFVAKGTVRAFEAKLKQEALVYQYLDKAQGELIPVCLGSISLADPYLLDIGVQIVQMLFMSWAGEQAREDLMLTMGRDLAAETDEAALKILSYGVEHGDVRGPNVLWSPETKNIMPVDFERSKMILKEVSQETLPNRKRKYQRIHTRWTVAQTCHRSQMSLILAAKVDNECE